MLGASTAQARDSSPRHARLPPVSTAGTRVAPRASAAAPRFLLALLAFAGLAGALRFQVGRREITPAAIRACAAPQEEKRRALELWGEALRLANGFLQSDFNRSLPAGRLELDEVAGMGFRFEDARLPLRVWCSFAGRLAVWTGATAQECAGGFRVGPGPGPAVVSHSWFRTRAGAWREARPVARTLLHELAHAVHGVGNFGFVQSSANYWEIVRHRRPWAERSFEAAPQGVSHEFDFWWMGAPEVPQAMRLTTREHAAEALADHLAAADQHCRHGPAERWRLAW